MPARPSTRPPARPEDYPAYSYQQDPSVPTISHDGPLTVMDGQCALCTFGARMIARLDRREEVRIATVQSPLGAALLAHYALAPDEPDTWLVIIDGKAFTSLPAMIRLARHMGGWGHILRLLSILPRAVQDWLYRRLARNRYALFGSRDMCAAPDAKLRRRLLR